MDSKVKFVHILFRNELKFNGNVVKMINDPTSGFDPEEHLFVSCYSEQFKVLKEYKNVILDVENTNLINKYGKKYDWIIAHSSRSIKDFLFAKKKYLKKTIFRYWGGGISGYQIVSGEHIKNVVKKGVNKLYINKINNLRGIGIANVVDVIDIERFLKNVRIYPLPYVIRENVNARVRVKNKITNKKKDNMPLNIMVGHRGSTEGNHIAILKILNKFCKENIDIYLPISYGEESYIRKIKQETKDMKGLKIHLIDNFMEYGEYCEFLNEMDIGIFAGNNSYALGNISVLLYYGKKLFLKNSGILKKAFDHEGVPCGIIDDISNMSFEEFASPIIYENGIANNLMAQDIEFYLKNWNDLLESLKSEMKK